MDFDAKDFRHALGRFATGIMVVTGVGRDGRPVGVTVNAFSSVSLDPPLVLFCLGRQASTYSALAEGERFAVNILAEDQRALSDRFAGKAEDKFAGLDYEQGAGGCPLLAGALGWLECRREATHDGGDHGIVVGRVEGLRAGGDGRPLLYFRGAYRTLGPDL
jgi:flavin reductase (DIM6/NTAB) family NADH-FMN oxidoreductase RutF